MREPSRTAEAGARARGCALFPAGAHPYFSPPQRPPGAPPPTGLPRPRPCQARAAEGKRAPGSRRDASQGVSPQSPCHLALRRGLRAHGLRRGRPLQMRRQLLQLWLRLGGRQWPRSPRGREERISRPSYAQPLAARRCRCLHPCLSPALLGRPGVQGKSKEESEAHQRCARQSPLLQRPAALLQSRPPRSARISCGCGARASYLRPRRAPATEHAQCRSVSPSQGAAPARFHFSRLWRRLCEERPEGPGGAGAEREKGGAGGGDRGGGGGPRY